MKELKELISKFWKKENSPAETKKLFELINDDDAVKTHLQREYQQEILAATNEITTQHFQELLNKLHLQIENSSQASAAKSFQLYSWVKWAAAILVITGGFWIYNYKPAAAPELVKSQQPKQTRKLQKQYNNGTAEMLVNLSDGSTVKLQPGSSLSYYEPFSKITRNISMNGEATFKVAKDKHHPFIVIAKGFTTTALGTEFTVNTNRTNHILVKLLEGKVVVKTTKSSGMDMRDVYLTPGQQLSVNTRSKQQHVSSFPLKNDLTSPVKKVRTVTPAIPIVFTEEPLGNVFDRLGKQYNTVFEYNGIDRADVQKLIFTGSFESSDALKVILPAICNMNDLTFKQMPDKIIISKQK
jgi:ferric-dicitrate binding protein FerR (iron transport regulator)